MSKSKSWVLCMTEEEPVCQWDFMNFIRFSVCKDAQPVAVHSMQISIYVTNIQGMHWFTWNFSKVYYSIPFNQSMRYEAVQDKIYQQRFNWNIERNLFLFSGTSTLSFAIKYFEKETVLLSSRTGFLPLPNWLKEMTRKIINNQLIK